MKETTTFLVLAASLNIAVAIWAFGCLWYATRNTKLWLRFLCIAGGWVVLSTVETLAYAFLRIDDYFVTRWPVLPPAAHLIYLVFWIAASCLYFIRKPKNK